MRRASWTGDDVVGTTVGNPANQYTVNEVRVMMEELCGVNCCLAALTAFLGL